MCVMLMEFNEEGGKRLAVCLFYFVPCVHLRVTVEV